MDKRLLTVLAAAIALSACASTPRARPDQVATAEEVEGSDEVSDAQADRNTAAQRAPSARPSEGGGGHVPHPVATGPEGDARYGERPAPEPGPQGRPLHGSVTGDEVNGRVALVDQANREIAVDAGDTTTQFRVADDAAITIEGRQASLADLRQGAQIRASLDRGGDLPEATRIEVMPSEGK